MASRHSRFITPAALPLYKRLIVEGAWWDLVDGVAGDLVGTVLLEHRDWTTPLLRRWLGDDDMWLRRTAIISQLNHKDATDAAFLFECCAARAHETEFFIRRRTSIRAPQGSEAERRPLGLRSNRRAIDARRKAIGWALRQYARTDPAAVRRFVNQQGDALSGLSRREALKHL
jgi:3-methyladenine DNA glycosylase AlkD